LIEQPLSCGVTQSLFVILQISVGYVSFYTLNSDSAEKSNKNNLKDIDIGLRRKYILTPTGSQSLSMT